MAVFGHVTPPSRPTPAVKRSPTAFRADGGSAVAVEADLADPATVPMLFDTAERHFGTVGLLVNNADHCLSDTFVPQEASTGLSAGGDVKRPFSPEAFHAHAAVNCAAPAQAMVEFARRHVSAGGVWGRIVNVSTDGSPAFDGEVSYGSTKHALEALSRAAAKELGPFGITVNIVSPGPIQTGYITPEAEQRIAAQTPLRRVGQPQDIADVISFLCSDQARWLTGQMLLVGGGWRMT